LDCAFHDLKIKELNNAEIDAVPDNFVW
jgi:hypothetical protein